jgi:hypothetical protein
MIMLWDRLKRRVLGGCVSNLERNASVGNRAFLDGLRDHTSMKMWVVFGRLFVLRPKKSISRASTEIETCPSHGNASSCTAPTTNLATSTRNLQNTKGTNSDQPDKGRCWQRRKTG